ncbi:hypothetical protein QVD17_20281 [Tagetes erecta]|uniref:PHD-type zinc finger plants domain-containing protein n=1 Tax=Tagetes erecta TaxID=13708 RepID=A0AAD8KKZ0_TARER|nr:hypothetical protein QVD17_20281 [Tagetes erecta]
MDVERVCCMCGDVGFPDKIFRCITCNDRFQHLYCSNYYNESSDRPELCDWCQVDEIKQRSKHDHGSSKKPESEHSGDKNKLNDRDREDGAEKRKSPTAVPSPRTSTRRYKLLKDVMC